MKLTVIKAVLPLAKPSFADDRGVAECRRFAALMEPIAAGATHPASLDAMLALIDKVRTDLIARRKRFTS